MSAYPGNLVQMEFFLTNTRTDSLEELGREIRERRKAGAALKLSVRIYDESDSLTEIACAFANLNAQFYAYKLGTLALSPWRRRYVARKMSGLREQGLFEAQRGLARAARKLKPIAIEDTYHGPLRSVERREMHELVETANKASAVWLFVFEPNEILSDKNRGIAHMAL